jgi:hypothetical protein
MNPLLAVASLLEFRRRLVAHFVQQEREADHSPELSSFRREIAPESPAALETALVLESFKQRPERRGDKSSCLATRR